MALKSACKEVLGILGLTGSQKYIFPCSMGWDPTNSPTINHHHMGRWGGGHSKWRTGFESGEVRNYRVEAPCLGPPLPLCLSSRGQTSWCPVSFFPLSLHTEATVFPSQAGSPSPFLLDLTQNAASQWSLGNFPFLKQTHTSKVIKTMKIADKDKNVKIMLNSIKQWEDELNPLKAPRGMGWVGDSNKGQELDNGVTQTQEAGLATPTISIGKFWA